MIESVLGRSPKAEIMRLQLDRVKQLLRDRIAPDKDLGHSER